MKKPGISDKLSKMRFMQTAEETPVDKPKAKKTAWKAEFSDDEEEKEEDRVHKFVQKTQNSKRSYGKKKVAKPKVPKTEEEN